MRCSPRFTTRQFRCAAAVIGAANLVGRSMSIVRRGFASPTSKRPGSLLSGATIVVMVAAFAAVPSAPAAAGTAEVISGQVLNTSCLYKLTATATGPGGSNDYSTGTLSGSITCGASVSLSVGASWDGTTVELNSISGKLLGHSISSPSGLPWSIDVSDDPSVDLPDFLTDFSTEALQQAEDNLLTSPLTIGPKNLFGGACSYTVKATWDGSDWSSGTLTGSVMCGSDSTISGSLLLTANWSGTDLSLDDLTGTFNGQSIVNDDGDSLTLPDDPAEDLGDMVDSGMSAIVTQLSSQVLAGFAGADNPVSQSAESDMPSTQLDDLDAYCASLLSPAGPPTPPPPAPVPPVYNDQVANCGNGVGYNNGATMGPDSQGYRDMDAAGDPDTSPLGDDSGSADEIDEKGACPELANDPPSDMFVICVPVVLTGDFNAAKQSIVLLPGGAILAAPVGSSLERADDAVDRVIDVDRPARRGNRRGEPEDVRPEDRDVGSGHLDARVAGDRRFEVAGRRRGEPQ